MNPVGYKILYALGLTASVVSMVDTFNGLQCQRKTGDYVQLLPTPDPGARLVYNGVMAIPYGAVRGVLFNFGQAVNENGSCGAASYTAQFSNGMNHTFNSASAGKPYRVVQAIFGIGGSVLGGIGAEEAHVLRRLPAATANLK